MFLDVFQHGLSVLGRKEAEVGLGDAQIGAYAYAGHGDEAAGEEDAAFFHEDGCELLYHQAVHLVLSDAVHGNCPLPNAPGGLTGAKIPALGGTFSGGWTSRSVG